MGRPIEWADERKKDAMARVCRAIANRMSLRKACEADDMPSRETVREWLLDDAEFSGRYARAREARADARSEFIDDITEEVKIGSLGHAEARVIIEAEKWQASKENAKRYGDRLNIDADINLTISDEQVEARLSHLLGKAGAIGAPGGEGEA